MKSKSALCNKMEEGGTSAKKAKGSEMQVSTYIFPAQSKLCRKDKKLYIHEQCTVFSQA